MPNYLENKDQNLYLPAMLIQSNALNLTMSGTHSFDNDIDTLSDTRVHIIGHAPERPVDDLRGF